MFKIIAIQMKPKENICILQSTKILHSKSCIFSQHLFTEPYNKWRFGLPGLENFRVRHVVVHFPPSCYTVSATLPLEFVLNEKVQRFRRSPFS